MTEEILKRLERLEEKCDRILEYFAEAIKEQDARPALSFDRIHENARRRRTG